MTFVTTEPGADPIVVEAHLAASRSRVFRAWTDPVAVKQWFGYEPGTLADAEIDLRPGGRWRFTEHDDADATTGFEGEYLTIEPDELLVFSWSKFSATVGGERAATDYSRVEIRLSANGAGTDMTIIHSALSDIDARTGFAIGWEAGIANLSTFVSHER